MEAAIELAARFEAELAGMFVEDVNLLRLADLPFAYEVSLTSATRRPLNAQELERQIRAQGTHIRRRLAGATERRQVRWTFSVSRGAVTPELLAASKEADVIILGRAGSSVIARGRMGSTARAIVAERGGLTLVLHKGTCLGSPVMTIYDGSLAAQEALSAAATLAERDDGSLKVLLVGGQSSQVDELEAAVDEQLAGEDLKPAFRRLVRPTVGNLVRIIHDEGCGLLVLPARSPLLHGEAVTALLDRIQVPVLVVR
jgi:nucleotide-binding universal stress UspA family protein